MEPLEALLWCEDALWYSVARLLGLSRRREEQTVEEICGYFVHEFENDCQGHFKSDVRHSISRKEVLELITHQQTGHWCRLPKLAKRRPILIPERPVLTIAKWRRPDGGQFAVKKLASFRMFEAIEHAQQAFTELRDRVVLPYQRKLGKDAWTSGKAMRRLLSPDRYRDAFDLEARRALEDAGTIIERLGQRGFRDRFKRLLLMRPKEAALEWARIAFQFPESRATLRQKYTDWVADREQQRSPGGLQ
jgi:hypothetical protein